MEDKTSRFQEKLSFYREVSGMTIDELAAEAGVDPGTLVYCEYFGKEPDITTLIKLAAFFFLPVDELVRGDVRDVVPFLIVFTATSPKVRARRKEKRYADKLKEVINMKNNFRENLSKLRKLKNLSQAELAEKIDVSVMTICHYESGRREPKVSTLIRLAEALDVSVDELTRGNIEVVASAP